jgi:hypothetical protein
MRIATLIATIALVSCGGGGGGSSPTNPSPGAQSLSRPVEQTDLEIAQAIYGGTPRTPADFQMDSPASGHEFVSTTHLKNTDIDRDVIASAPQFELCTDDWNQALGWSETSAVNAPQYADLVETNDDTRYFEFGRVRQGTPELYQRARVFKCAYLNRATANLRAASGAAGQLNRRPLTGAELRAISEYLWQFTTYNNFGHVVLKSANTDSATLVQHTLYIGSLTRKGLSAACDRIDVIAWRHSADSSGALTLGVQTLFTFGARENGAIELCPG